MFRVRRNFVIVSSTCHSRIDTFLLSIVLGTCHALLGWLTYLGLGFCFAILPPSAWLLDFVDKLPFVVLIGGLTGAFWSLFAIPILRYRSLKPASCVLGLVLATIAIGGAFLGAFPPAISMLTYLVALGPTIVFIITCLILRRVVPATLRLSVCIKCGHEMSNNAPGVCSACGDTTLFRRRSRQFALFALVGLSVSAGIAGLFVLTRAYSCGYYGYPTVVGFERGALLFHFDSLRYEGWVWSDVSFVHRSGYVWWPIFEEKTVLIPLWMFLVLVFPPALLIWRRSRRPAPGFCKKCGYNLTGLASARCPECGANVTRGEQVGRVAQV